MFGGPSAEEGTQREIPAALPLNFIEMNNAMSPPGSWDIHTATLMGDLQQVQRLLEEGCAVNSVSSDRRTPLYSGCLRTNPGIVKVLLSYGADPNQIVHQFHSLTTPLLTALRWCHETTARTLIEAGAFVNSFPGMPFSPLSKALDSNCSTEMIEFLLEQGARENTDAEENALISALKMDEPETVRVLLKHNYSLHGIKEVEETGLSPIEIVLRSSYSSLPVLFKILMDEGVQIPPTVDWSKLLRKMHYTVNAHVVELIKMLLQFGAMDVVDDWIEEMVVEKIWRKFYCASRVIRYEAELMAIVQIIYLYTLAGGRIQDSLRMLRTAGLKYKVVNSITASHLELPPEFQSVVVSFYNENLEHFPSLLKACVHTIRRSLGEGRITENNLKCLKLPSPLLKLLTLPELDDVMKLKFPFMSDTLYLVSGISNG